MQSVLHCSSPWQLSLAPLIHKLSRKAVNMIGIDNMPMHDNTLACALDPIQRIHFRAARKINAVPAGAGCDKKADKHNCRNHAMAGQTNLLDAVITSIMHPQD